MVNIPFSDIFRRIWGYRLELVREHQNGDTLPNLRTMFSFKSLERATKNFRYRLREDGYVSSYKGTLENGTLVEVQVFGKSRWDFFSVMRIMSRISHRNVIEFIGYCAEANHRIIVCKFMGDYDDLNHLLFNKEGECSKLSWPMRASICLGVARGIEYLHQGISPPVVHRDIKPSNVVVDANFNPKITNFSVAMQIGNDSSDLTGVAGTLGHIDPEYVRTGRLTEKADVYSFGVLLLEVITGRKYLQLPIVDDTSLIDWVWELRESGCVQECVDPTLSGFPEDEVVRFISVALHCVQVSSNLRPIMFEVLHMLSGAIDFNDRTLTNPRHSVYYELNSPTYSMSVELNSPADSMSVELNSPADSNFDELNTPADGQQENEELCAQNEMDKPDPLTVTAEDANSVGTCSNAVLVTTNWEIFDSGDGSLAQPSVLSSTKITQDWEHFD